MEARPPREDRLGLLFHHEAIDGQKNDDPTVAMKMQTRSKDSILPSPTMPMTEVTMHPLGSLPGMMNLARPLWRRHSQCVRQCGLCGEHG